MLSQTIAISPCDDESAGIGGGTCIGWDRSGRRWEGDRCRSMQCAPSPAAYGSGCVAKGRHGKLFLEAGWESVFRAEKWMGRLFKASDPILLAFLALSLRCFRRASGGFPPRRDDGKTEEEVGRFLWMTSTPRTSTRQETNSTRSQEHGAGDDDVRLYIRLITDPHFLTP